ncbi:hypothetical protein CRG95_17505 [Escherichia sp. E4208]|nr:hypothetical protein CRT22_05920 [Escherichia sp. E5028]TGB61664.1 hypothetical protein CRI69_02245 [Escherichia sp. E4742]TGB68031.1 hypothetical protein CRG96_12960 [Escherichia sp. E4930]TGB68414.1 hypothetical protein CQB02_04175 [Escherichia coli]TGB76149.1 hypothetical protein CRI67_09570 [Escherichia sp. E4702]TGB79242.1 hypothetical protein CRI66_06870 [Escherichia sp. E4694]TGB82656.1 hypothetical protein CRG95_17505 [Escherichia sp. E4208]TGB91991.1 hypothetical protein CRI64_15
MIKSVAQLPLKPINYDGVHAIPINKCVNNSAHETDLIHIGSVNRFVADSLRHIWKPTLFRVPWQPEGANLKLRGNILYTTIRDVVSLGRFIS